MQVRSNNEKTKLIITVGCYSCGIPQAWFAPILGAALLCLAFPAGAADYEKFPKVSAKKLFPDVDLKNKQYEVISKVPTDGFLTRTEIKSRFGAMVAVGPGMLETRLHEIEALAKLETLESSDEFQRAMKDSGGEKTKGIEKMADNPKETAQGMAEGIGRFFKRTYRATKTGLQSAGDVINEQAPGVQEGQGANLPGKAIGPVENDGESKYTKAVRASGDVALNILGFDDARRRLCKRMQVDPYTTNKVLDEKLDEVTKSLFAGNLAVDFATALIPGGSLISQTNRAGNWVWDTPPGDLRVAIEKDMLAMQFTQEDVDRLLRHRWYPLSFQAALTRSLTALDGVKGRTDIMGLVLSVTTYDQARFVVYTLSMTANYHKKIKPVDSLQVLGTIIAWRGDGTPVVASPVDYLSWTEGIDNFSSRAEISGKEPDVHIAGLMSDKARSNLKKRGWRITENSTLFTREFAVAE